MKVAVVGCGYVGLVSAVGLASVGHSVVGIEAEPARRGSIAAGIPPFHEPGLEELLDSVLRTKAFQISDDVGRVREAEVILLAVQTPPGPDGVIDLSALRAAAATVAAALRDDGERRVVATRSTAIPGTAERVVQPLLSANTAAAANPEFLREGSAVRDYLHPDRIVVGSTTKWGSDLLKQLYKPFAAPVYVTTPATAELAKYTSNAFLATLISFSNEIGRICEDLPGVDVEDVLGILRDDHRLNPICGGERISPEILSYLQAGCGYGGSCLPKDLAALIATRDHAGATAPLLQAVREINEQQPTTFVDLARRALGGLDGRRCAVLGLAFKAGTDDLRDSAALKTINALVDAGASVVAYDPLVHPEALSAAGVSGVELVGSLEDALIGVDACLITTTEPEFDKLPELLGARDDRLVPLVIDGRRALKAAQFAPDRYIGVGRATAGQN